MPPAAILLWLAGGVVIAAFSGCASHILARITVDAPNRRFVPPLLRNGEFAKMVSNTYAQAWQVDVGPPAAELAVAVLEPGNYTLEHALAREDKEGQPRLMLEMSWVAPGKIPGPPPGKPKATVVVLHGYGESKESVLHWGMFLAQRGYRCVLVDLRGHGLSTGERIGFGAFEAADLARMLDDLYARGLTHRPVGVLGISYGASMALLWASQDARVATVVSLQAFSEGNKAVVEFARGISPEQTTRISPATFEAAVNRAARRGRFTWEQASVIAAMARVRHPVLFYHGAKDTWLSPDHSRALFARAAVGSRLSILPEDDHMSLAIRLQPIADEVDQWFARHIGPNSENALVEAGVRGRTLHTVGR